MVSNDVFRGRYRKSFEKPEAITPGAVLEYSFSLHTQNYAFRQGHRVMVQVQSTWFPLIDRNPQTFVPNIFMAKAADFAPGHASDLSVRQVPVARVHPRREPHSVSDTGSKSADARHEQARS